METLILLQIEGTLSTPSNPATTTTDASPISKDKATCGETFYGAGKAPSQPNTNS